MSISAGLPFDRYADRGRALLGRPGQGDATARHGYGPPVFDQCGFRCAYCGFEMGKRYEDWLQLSVDHVVPRGSRTQGYPDDWLEDIANLVTCCRPCNEFSNGYRVREPAPSSLSAFFDARDRVFVEKRALVLQKHAQEREWFRKLVTTGQPGGLPVRPTRRHDGHR